jgi:hypothetical protein
VDPASPPAPLPELPQATAESGCDGFKTVQDARNERRFIVWMLTATLAYTAAALAFKWRASGPPWLPGLLTVAAWLLALHAVRCFLTYLRQADELLRKIQTEALALGFAAGAVVSLLYPLLEKLGAPALGGYATFVVMMLAWAAGSWFGTRRYRGSHAR